MRISILAILLAACGGGHVAPTQTCSTASDCTTPGLAFCVDGACHACDGASACMPAAPVCAPDTWTCEACAGDGDCAAFAGAPHCAADGTCVGCVDSAQCANPAPTCDTGSHACRACASDDDCASAVCDRATGACTAASAVLYASPTGGDGAACTQSDPCSVNQAVLLADATRTTLKLLPGSYTAAVAIGGKHLVIDGEGATWHPTASALAAISIGAGADVAIRGLKLLADGRTAISCVAAAGTPPTLTLESTELDSVVVTTFNLVEAARCTASIARSRFIWHSAATQMVSARSGAEVTFQRTWFQGGDGLGAASGAKLHVVNSVWLDVNGQHGALAGDDTTSGDVELSTLIDSPVHCLATATTPTWRWSSNILASSGTADVADGAACTYEFNVMNPQAGPVPGANNLRDKDPKLVDVAHGDYHPSSASPAIDRADPAMTATEDYEGLARPEGAHDDCGAFEYRP